MTFNEYQEQAIGPNAVYGVGNKIIYPALGVGNEAGEILGKVKKVFLMMKISKKFKRKSAIVSGIWLH